jgi:hypothetical protein
MENKTHAICGAKTRSGAPCRQKQMKNGRCRMHGGKNTGPKTEEGKKKVSQNAIKHGAYIERLLNDQEKEIYDFLHHSTIEKYKLDEDNPMHMATLHRACVTYIKLTRLDQWEMEREWEMYTDGKVDPEGNPVPKEMPVYDQSGEIIGYEKGRTREIRWSKNTPPWDTHFQKYMQLLAVDRATQVKQDGDQKTAAAVVDGFAWLWGQKSKEEE